MKREFLMLASVYRPTDYVAQWFASEKLDGMRVWWDGGVSRGVLKHLVPWANNDKDSRYKEAPIATGLWTRYGNVIHAPDWWLDNLPKISLDGELYRKGHRQHMMSIAKRLEPVDNDWKELSFHVFDTPAYGTILKSGTIKNPNAKQYWTSDSLSHFMRDQADAFNALDYMPRTSTVFETRVKVMERMLVDGPVTVHKQIQLPNQNAAAKDAIASMLDGIVNDGGEGLILRAPHSLWTPERSKQMVKVKPSDDMEVKVVGYITGKEGKHLGRMGSLIVECPYGQFAISGFKDAERGLNLEAESHAENNPGVECLGASTTHFQIGDIISIKHRGFTADRIPQEARYWRRKVDE